MIHVLNEECTQRDLLNFATTHVLWRTAPTEPNRTTVLQVREKPRCRLARRLQLLQEAADIPSPQEAADIPSPCPKNLLHTSNYGPVTEPRTGTAEALRKSCNALLFQDTSATGWSVDSWKESETNSSETRRGTPQRLANISSAERGAAVKGSACDRHHQTSLPRQPAPGAAPWACFAIHLQAPLAKKNAEE